MSCNCFAASFEGVYLFAMLIGKWWEREGGGGGGEKLKQEQRSLLVRLRRKIGGVLVKVKISSY